MMRIGHTKPFTAPDGSVVPGSVATIERMMLGGVAQWVMIRGYNVDNPLLVMLHGGPGMSETSFFRAYNSPLERSFTVVYWDQRGAGKSYAPNIPRESMTTAQYVADLDGLVDAMCRRFGKEQVVLFGHSWGSLLGVLYSAQHPRRVAAYVGSGQVGSWPDAEAASYAYALEEAQRKGKAGLVEKLRAIGPPPYPASSLWTQRLCLTRVDGSMKPANLWKLTKMTLGARETSVLEMPEAYRAFRWSLDATWDEVSQLDLNVRAPVLEMPALFFLGRHDHWAPTPPAVAYIEKLKAPFKRIVWFEHSGHEPFADEPDKFNAAMLEHVLPLVEHKPARPSREVTPPAAHV